MLGELLCINNLYSEKLKKRVSIEHTWLITQSTQPVINLDNVFLLIMPDD